MNAERLNRIAVDIIEAEEKFNFQSHLGNIVTHFQNNSSKALNQEKLIISKNLQNTPIALYVDSDLKILKKLGMLDLFDMSINETLDKILSSQAHEVLSELINFRDKRSHALEKLRRLKQVLDDLGIKVYDLPEGKFHLIFSLPEKYHDLDNLQKATKDLDNFLKALSVGLEPQSKYTIDYVDNGCIEFIIQAIPELASKFVDVLETILTIKGAIELKKQAIEKIQDYKKSRKKIIEDEVDAELEEKKEKCVNDLIIKIGVSKNSTEDTNRIKLLFRVIVKYFEEGATAEVKTPYLEMPEEYSGEDKEEKRRFKEQIEIYKRKQAIDTVNQKIYLIQQGGDLNLGLPNSDANDSE